MRRDTADLLEDRLAGEAAHPGAHRLARLEADELPPDEAASTRAHAEACPDCSARLVEIARDRQAFLALRPPGTLTAALAARRPGRRWWLPAGFGVAAFAALAVALLSGKPPSDGATVRLKGGLELSFHVRAAGEVKAGIDGEAVRPGDQVQLRYSTPAHRYLAVVSLDTRGAVTPFYDDGGRSLSIEPGAGRLLEGSVVLDDALGPERVVGCFSGEPLPTEAIVAAGQRALQAAGGDPRRVERLDLPCDQASFLLEKRAP